MLDGYRRKLPPILTDYWGSFDHCQRRTGRPRIDESLSILNTVMYRLLLAATPGTVPCSTATGLSAERR